MSSSFLYLTSSTSKGELAPILVDVTDISSVRPVLGIEERVLISLKSNPDFPIWVTENMDFILDALEDMDACISEAVETDGTGKAQ